MKESIFNRIYTYRERQNKGALENYFIEILAFCLEKDNRFMNQFLKKIGENDAILYKINTQAVYKYGRPDIEIYLEKSKTSILIECKVDHQERFNQLNDYLSILENKNADKKYLIYLTKYYENKSIRKSNINFIQLKWADIYSLIDDSSEKITNELKQFIKDKNMESSKNFQYLDLTSMVQITSTISKMDEVIDGVKDEFAIKIAKLSRDSSRSSRLENRWYGSYHWVNYKKPDEYEIQVGFNWEDVDDDILIGIRVKVHNSVDNPKSQELIDFFKKNLKKWEYSIWENKHSFSYQEYIAKFILEKDEQIPEMTKYLQQGLNELYNLKKVKKNIFG
jgi:hypothetical protein